MTVQKDSLGTITITEGKLWGTTTERVKRHFKIGDSSETMPFTLIRSLALIKKCAALANQKFGLISDKKAGAIVQSAEEIMEKKWDGHFPLPVWQTGSGTGSNMNVNEVIASRANQLLKSEGESVHPNDDVNRCQSSNDVFPTAMHVSAVLAAESKFKPALKKLEEALERKSGKWKHIIKVGRTHLMDATPITLGQEFSGYHDQVVQSRKRAEECVNKLRGLTLGGTAVGTGINAVPGFSEWTISLIAKETKVPFFPLENKFSASSAHDELVAFSGVLRTLACSLMKLGNDMRLMASGPRAGLSEIEIPAGEPGSSIMPGKINPTQCEALTMVCAEVMGNDVAIGIGGSNGHFELNVFKPLIIFNVLRSVNLLSDAMQSFVEHCLEGASPLEHNLQRYLERSLMLVTALTGRIGYDKASEIAKYAWKNNVSLKQAALKLNYLSSGEFDRIVRPEKMLGLKEFKKETSNGTGGEKH